MGFSQLSVNLSLSLSLSPLLSLCSLLPFLGRSLSSPLILLSLCPCLLALSCLLAPCDVNHSSPTFPPLLSLHQPLVSFCSKTFNILFPLLSCSTLLAYSSDPFYLGAVHLLSILSHCLFCLHTKTPDSSLSPLLPSISLAL